MSSTKKTSQPPAAKPSPSALRQLELQLKECMRRDQQGLRRQVQRLQQSGAAEAAVAQLAERVAASCQRRTERGTNVPYLSYPDDLPVAGKKDDIVAAIRANQVLIVCGETGSGKTTQLPKICLEAGRGVAGYIGHTQPRRLAARSVAARIAEELGQPLGKAVGFKIRFQDTTSPDAYIKLMTDGILLAETQQDRFLDHYDTLIVDEAHERSLNIDFLLGYLKWLLPRRPDLKLIITSATIDPDSFSRHFNGAPIINVSGRTYPVEIRYRPVAEPDTTSGAGKSRPQPRLAPTALSVGEGDAGVRLDLSGVPKLVGQAPRAPVEEVDETDKSLQQAIVAAADELHRERAGDILVFLSGEREIRETAESLRKHHPPHVEILPLYSRLAVAEQDKVFKPHGRDRIVLATNVAETSLTVPGIRCVIDAGHSRISRYSHRSKLQRLPIEKVSQASANQRAGRCGRIGPGICIRLYSEQDYQNRPQYTEPEILRTNLAAVILQMQSLRLGDISSFPFLQPPDERLVRDGVKTLQELNALDDEQRLTPLGKQLARLPLDPKLSRMLLAAADFNCLTEATIIVACLSIQDPRERPLDKADAADAAHERFKHEHSDFLAIFNLWNTFQEEKKHLSNSKLRAWCKDNFLSYLRMRDWEDVHQQLTQLVKGELNLRPNQIPAGYAEIHKALLTGLLANVGLKSDTSEYTGARGQKFQIFPGSFLFKLRPQWIMAAETVETSKVYARTVAKIEPEWIEQVGSHLIKHQHYEPHWERKPARVAVHERSALYGLVIQAGRKIPFENIDRAGAREIFIREALVHQNYDCRAEFFRHNQVLLESADYLQQKGRRVDLVVDEQWIFQFYDERLPEHIVSGASFDRWRREAERTQPNLLKMTREDITRQEDERLDAVNFPDHLDVGDLSIKLEYRFLPGDDEDGVTAVVPLHQLNQITREPFDWLVPGLLKEKVVALIKSLPKHLRRHFVPVPDTAERLMARLLPTEAAAASPSKPEAGWVERSVLQQSPKAVISSGRFADLAALQALKSATQPATQPAPKAASAEAKPEADRFRQGKLARVLAEWLHFSYGVLLVDEDWDETGLPPHLRMNFRVVDDKGKTLAFSRDLADLQRRYGAQAGAQFQALTAQNVSVGGCVDWRFGDLPARMESKAGQTLVLGYPALVDEGETVSLKAFDTEAEARARHRKGLARLILLVLGKDGKYVRKNLAVKPSQEMAYSHGVGAKSSAPPSLRDELFGLVIESLFLDGQSEIRTEKAFRERLEKHRGSLMGQANAVSRLVSEILDAAAALEKVLSAWPANDPSAQDMREQLQRLLPAGFLRTHALERLQEFPRYLKALTHRLDKLRQDAARDRRSLDLLRPFWTRYWETVEKGLAREPSESDEFRWLLEEFRVSLFAQHLKTPAPVSAKRLEEQWAGRARA